MPQRIVRSTFSGHRLKKCSRVDNGTGPVEVRFSDGKKEHFDLVVGADGIGSRTRRHMLGSNSNNGFFPIPGQYIGYFTAPRPIQEGEEYIATQYMATGQRGIMIRRSHPKHGADISRMHH